MMDGGMMGGMLIWTIIGLKLAALTFSKDVTQLSCCAT